MANEEINDQTAKTTPASTDEYLLQETAGGTNKKITYANLFSNIGKLTLDVSTVVISSGAVTPTTSFVEVGGAADAADDLDTISGAAVGDIFILTKKVSSGTVTVKDAVDNLKLAGDFAMDNALDTITLIALNATNIIELSRSSNA